MTVPVNIGSKTSSTTGVISLSLTTTAAADAGTTVVCALALQYTTVPSGVTFSDSAGNTWTVSTFTDVELSAVAYSALGTQIPAGGTITASWTGTTDVTGVSLIADNIPASATLRGSVGAVTDVASSATHTLSVSETSGDTVWAVDVSAPSNTISTTSSPFTQIASVAGRRPMVTAYDQPVSTGSVSFTDTWANAHSGSMIALSFTTSGTGAVSASDTFTVADVSSLSFTTSNVAGTETFTLADASTEISVSDGIPDAVVDDEAAINLARALTDTFTFSDTSAVSTGPSVTDLFTFADVSSIAVLGTNPTTSDLFTVLDVSSLSNSLAIDTSDGFVFTDNSFLVEAGSSTGLLGTVTIISPRGTVTFQENLT